MQLSNRTKGILYLILSSFGFAVLSLFIRLAGDVPVMEKTLYRSAITSLICIPLMAGAGCFRDLSRGGLSAVLPKGCGPDLLWRCIYGITGMVAYFWTIDHMGLADANMLSKTSPFFSILFSLWLLKEQPAKLDYVCILIAMAGAALVVKPTRGIASLPALIGLLGGFISGGAYTYVRRLGMRGLKSPVIVFCFSVFSVAVTLPFVLLSSSHARGMQILYLVLAACFAAMTQLSLTVAYRYAPAKEISVFDYSQVLFAAFFGLVIWGELPDLLSMAGYVLIVAGAAMRIFLR